MSLEPTQPMVERFVARTRRHIALVGENLMRMEGYLGLDRRELGARARIHDASKFGDLESLGYVWLTWIYDCKDKARFEIPAGVSGLVERCLKLHRERNSHHPEAHKSPDAMSVLDLVEMVCDWTAIAQENGGHSARPWAESNISRWDFARATREFVFLTIDELDRRNRIGRMGRRVMTMKRAPSATDAATRPVVSPYRKPRAPHPRVKPRTHAVGKPTSQ